MEQFPKAQISTLESIRDNQITLPTSARRLEAKTEYNPSPEHSMILQERQWSLLDMTESVDSAAICGGLAVSLLQGEIYRTHKDIEIIIDSTELEQLTLSLQNSGYKICTRISQDRENTSETYEEAGTAVLGDTSDLFIVPFEPKIGNTVYELVPYTRRENQIVIGGYTLSIPPEFELTTKVTYTGREIEIQNPAFIYFFKSLKGRERDIRDLEILRANMTASEIDIAEAWIAEQGLQN